MQLLQVSKYQITQNKKNVKKMYRGTAKFLLACVSNILA